MLKINYSYEKHHVPSEQVEHDRRTNRLRLHVSDSRSYNFCSAARIGNSISSPFLNDTYLSSLGYARLNRSRALFLARSFTN